MTRLQSASTLHQLREQTLSEIHQHELCKTLPQADQWAMMKFPTQRDKVLPPFIQSLNSDQMRSEERMMHFLRPGVVWEECDPDYDQRCAAD